MRPLVIGDADDIDGAEEVGPAPPLDLPMHQRAAVEEQAVVHVGVLQALHLAEEALSGILVGADDIEGRALLLLADDGNLVGEVLDGIDANGKDVVEELEERLLVAEDVLEGVVDAEVEEGGDAAGVVDELLHASILDDGDGLKLFFDRRVQLEMMLFHR